MKPLPVLSLLYICIFSFVTDALSKSSEKQHIDSLNIAAYGLRNNRDATRMKLYINSALDLSQKINYKKGQGWAHLNTGIIHYKNHKNDSAIFSLQRATTLLESENELFGVALCMSFRGYIYQRLGNYEKAEELFRKEITTFRKLEDHFETANSLSNLAVNFIAQSKYPEALAYSTEALETRNQFGLNPSKEYQNIVVIYHKLKEYDKALKYLSAAVKLNIDHQDTSGLIKAYNSIAVNYYGRSTKNYDSTKFYLEKSLALAQKARFVRSQIVALGNIAEIYKEESDFEKAKEYIHGALDLQKSLNNNQHLFSLSTLAEIFLSEGKLDSGLIYSKEVFSAAVQLRDKSLEKKSSKFISQIFERLSEFDSALYYHKIFKAANDSVFNSDKGKILSNLQIQLETLEQENKIEKLLQDKVFNSYINYGLIAIIVLLLSITFFVFKTIQERNRRKQSKLELEKQILEQKIEHNKTELFNYTLNMINKNNSMMDVEEEVRSSLTKDTSEINTSRILSKISIGKSSERDWENFNKYFGAVHTDFFTKFKSNYPSLTNYELRLLSLIKLHLNNKEMADILAIEAKSVKMACYRLKKKLELSETQKLADFVLTE